MKLSRSIKIGVLAALAFGFACVVLIATCYCVVKFNASGKLYTDVDDIPHNKVGLLLGTAPLNRWGNRNPYYDYRINAAAELYGAGKLDYILVSGDNHSTEYDEPSCMRQSLIEAGVPKEKIILDYAGFRTLDSVVRAKEIFGQDSLTVISQPFHNERALYLAKHYGIDAVGYNARDVKYWRICLKVQIREFLARVKLFIDLCIGKKPKFLGEKVEIE